MKGFLQVLGQYLIMLVLDVLWGIGPGWGLEIFGKAELVEWVVCRTNAFVF